MAVESYLAKPLSYKVRKVWRYVELYGPARTLVKVRGQLHMAQKEGFAGTIWTNPGCSNPDSRHRRIGIIGCGSFSFGNIAYYLQQISPGALKGVMDIDAARARSLAKRHAAAFATTDAEAILRDPAIELVFIASNHATHAPYAIQALDAGKHVHIEKPHVVTEQQLEDLLAAMRRNPDRQVFLGFNRPRSPLFGRLTEELARESGPTMINWFVAGHEINDDHWYFSEAEGGRILGNLCHWTDLTLKIVGSKTAFPCRIVPVSTRGAKSDFVTSMEFADGSLATITFSAKGHTFEGVRETLNLHKGNLLAEIKDFGSLRIERDADVKTIRPMFREHGHKANILNSWQGGIEGAQGRSMSAAEVAATARLFLAVREAHQTGRATTVGSQAEPALAA